MFASAALPAFLFIVGLIGIPESPRWLIERGRTSQARSILRAIGGEAYAEASVAEIAVAVQQEVTGARILFRQLRKPLVLAVTLAVLQQITGINTVLYYGAILFQEHSGAGSNSAAIGANVLIGVANLVFTLAALVIIDRIGRRQLLLGSALGMTIALAALATAFHRAVPSFPIVLGSTIFYVAAFAIGLGPGTWVYVAELFPTAVRGRAMSIATASLWAGCILVTNSFLTIVRALGPSGAFLLYAASSALTCGFVLALPETRGKSLVRME